MKRIALWGLGAVAGAALIALLLPGERDFRGVPASSLANGPSGAKALYRFLGAMGLEVQRWRSRDYRDLPDGTFWILARDPVSSLRLEGLKRFVDRGNTVIGSFEAVEPLLKAEGVSDTSKTFLPVFGLRRRGGGKLDSSDAHVISGTPGPQEVFATSETSQKKKEGNVVIGWHSGAGEIIVLGADDIVRNDEIGRAENGLLLLDLARTAGRSGHHPPRTFSAAGHPQIFDEVSTGVATKGFGDLFAELPYRYGLLEAAVALLVLLLSFLPRRAPVDLPPAFRRRTTVEHLDAVARLWRRTKDPGLPLAELVAAANERSRRGGGEGAAPFVDWVKRRRADLAARAAAAIERAELLASGKPPLAAAQAAAAELIALEREASRW